MHGPALASIALCVAAALASSLAWADEQMTPLAASGDWNAVEHQESQIAAPDLCAAFNSSGLVFRFGSDGLEVRIVNSKWSLPANVQGEIVLAVAGKAYTYSIGTNSDSMVGSLVPPGEVADLLDQVEQASAMTFQTGKAKPVNVSLAGSKTVLTAFRTCAGIGGGTSAGENPFK